MTAILSILSGVVLLVLTVWILRNRQRVDPALVAWRRFTSRLGRHGVAWQAWEGPIQFSERAATVVPRHAQEIAEIARLYAGLRYGANPQPDQLLRLKSRIANFRP